jgi:UDP-N-acetylglucosamine--N-acetylmuramyl-(pentapeptide) pyrophosphoryl-undecaprenol N-acetylglucosamine transferase
MPNKRIIIAGGGTGGHIFPAVAVANALRQIEPDIEILFVGAKGKMEMEKVPKAGYEIRGLDIAGLNRGQWWRNVSLPLKLFQSFFQVRNIFSSFKPEAAFGVGGYSSYPVLRYAQSKGIPTYIHEANAFGGKSNQLLAKRARRVFVGTPGMERFFPASKILFTGNPVRQEILAVDKSQAEALAVFGLTPGKVTLLVVGGSLGALSINMAVASRIGLWVDEGFQLIWQTGKSFEAEALSLVKSKMGVYVSAFISDMNAAYRAADMVISRSGAMSVTELCLTHKAVIFVPYPYAAEDHQTANAIALVNKNAAILVSDKDAPRRLMSQALDLALDKSLRMQLSNNIQHLAASDADVVIAKEILKDIENT